MQCPGQTYVDGFHVGQRCSKEVQCMTQQRSIRSLRSLWLASAFGQQQQQMQPPGGHTATLSTLVLLTILAHPGYMAT